MPTAIYVFIYGRLIEQILLLSLEFEELINNCPFLIHLNSKPFERQMRATKLKILAVLLIKLLENGVLGLLVQWTL